jgi:hypothetical protein
MRSVVGFVAGVTVAVALAGCGQLESQYYREGVGTNLYREAIPETTRLQDLYVAHICHQAGLSRDGETCADMGIRQEWALFVQAGMNDIDLRCDAYLAWLDDKRRTREPILKELLVLSGATAGILKAVNTGPTALALTAIAFSLAADTFTVVSNRLVTMIDQNTVQSVVLDNQLRYRSEILHQRIDNKPAALYLLRGYLRICMPFSIEMTITNTLAVYHRSGAGALVSNPPLVTRAPRATFRSSMIITRPDRPLPDFRPGPVNLGPNRIGPFEQRLPVADIKRFQAACGLGQTGDLGDRNSPTRLALSAYLNSLDPSRVVRPDPPAHVITQRDGDALYAMLDDHSKCPP